MQEAMDLEKIWGTGITSTVDSEKLLKIRRQMEECSFEHKVSPKQEESVKTIRKIATEYSNDVERVYGKCEDAYGMLLFYKICLKAERLLDFEEIYEEEEYVPSLEHFCLAVSELSKQGVWDIRKFFSHMEGLSIIDLAMVQYIKYYQAFVLAPKS